MTDHILNAELCAKCPAKKICQAIVPDGEWNPHIGKNPCPAVLQKPYAALKDEMPPDMYYYNWREKTHP